MITSNNRPYKLSEAHQKDKFVIAGGKENLIADSRGKVYPMGGVPPKAAPSAKVVTGGGELTSGIGYAYAYSYLNPYQDCETAPSPASTYVGKSDAGEFKSLRFSSDGMTVYVTGEDLEKGEDYYNGHTLACEVVNNEYTSIYSEWQYRTVTDYYYDSTNNYGVFRLNRPFFNVDPDENDQQYAIKIDDLETEEGIVGGKSKGKNKLILDPSASQSPSDYRFKTIHITQGRGKGQKRVIMDANLREDGLIEVTVDAPWKTKPKFVDNDKKDLYALREEAEGKKGANRKQNFYKQYFSSEYVISDPLRYNGLAIDANVIEYNNKSKRVKLSGLGHSEGLITGNVLSYTDFNGTKDDRVTVSLASDNFDSSSGKEDQSSYSIETFQNKRFRVFDGPGAGLDCLISDVVKASGGSITLALSTFGKMKKKRRPNASSQFVIYSGTSLSSSLVNNDNNKIAYPRVFKADNMEDNHVRLTCCATDDAEGDRDDDYLCASEAANCETYNSGRCFIMLQVKPTGAGNKKSYYITRQIIKAETIVSSWTNNGNTYEYSRLVLEIADLPDDVEIILADKKDTDHGTYFIYSDNLQDGLYTGWVAAFYNTKDAQAKGQKKVRTSRVAGYLDETGEIFLCNAIPGIGEGWQCVLYSEYSRQFGSRVKVYEEDKVTPSYTSSKNSRFFHLDYFASGEDDFYKGWKLEFLYGTAKKVKGKNLYAQEKHKKAYTVASYKGERRLVDVCGDSGDGVRMKPIPTGDEFVTLYDPASYIFKIFSNDEEEADSENDGNNSSGDGVKMLVSGIVKSTTPGFDKIKLYRASETTETYRLCAILENKTQNYTDNAAESELGEELDFEHAAPNPAKYVASRNAVFALAGSAAGSASAKLFKNAFFGLEDTDNAASFFKEGLSYVHGDFSGTVLKTTPLIGALVNPKSRLVIPVASEDASSDLRLTVAVSLSSDGVICSSESMTEQSGLRKEVFPHSGTVSADSPDIKADVNYFYLAADSKNSYRNGTLRIIDADKEPHAYTFGREIDYDPKTKKVTLKSGTIKLWATVKDFGTDYSFVGGNKKALQETHDYRYVYKPADYSIYQAAWQIYASSGEVYYLNRNATAAKKLDAASFCEDAVIVSAVIPQDAGNQRQSITFGGEIKTQLNGDSCDAKIYYVSLSKADVFDKTLASYSLANLCFTDAWDTVARGGNITTSSTKAFGTVPANETGAEACQLYVEHENNAPYYKAHEIRHYMPGYNLVCFAQGYTGEAQTASMRIRDVDLEVQITSPYAGQREKVRLANVYNLNDGWGTKITGIVATVGGFIVFKDRGVYVLNPDAPSLQCVTHEFGCIAPGSIAEGRSGIYWMSSGGRILRQNFAAVEATSYVSKGLQPWFDGDEEIDGYSVDTSKLESDTQAAYDSEYGYYIIALPCKKGNLEKTFILAWDEQFEQWYRIEDSASQNAAKHLFSFERRAAFAGGRGIYSFAPNKNYKNAWRYESRWRDEGSNDKIKLIKRVKINSKVDSSVTNDPEATIKYFKDQKTTPEPNLLSWTDGPATHPFYTNVAKAQVEAGVRGYEWKFVLEGTDYINIKNMDIERRGKGEAAPELSNTPNEEDL